MKKYFLIASLVFLSFFTTSCIKGEIKTENNSKGKSFPIESKIATINGLPIQINPGKYVAFDDIEKLSETADIIVIAQPLNNLEESKKISKKNSDKEKQKIDVNTSVVTRDEEGKIIGGYYTLTPVKVKKVLKGDLDNKEIGVIQSAALANDGKEEFVIALE